MHVFVCKLNISDGGGGRCVIVTSVVVITVAVVELRSYNNNNKIQKNCFNFKLFPLSLFRLYTNVNVRVSMKVWLLLLKFNNIS